jgi:hypothetical protein
MPTDDAVQEGGDQQSRRNRIMDDLTTMNDTCQKPSCTADSTDTYRDEHGNGLDLCGRHYYELVSGERVTATSPTALFPTELELGRQTADVPTTPGDPLESQFSGVGTRRRGTRDLHPSVQGDDDER